MKCKNFYRKVFAFLMAVLLSLSNMPAIGMTVYAGDEDGSFTQATTGSWTDYASAALSGATDATVEVGTADNPYLITCAADFATLAVSYNTTTTTEGKYFKILLPNNITELDMSEHYWEPVEKFAGNLDGNGVTIKGLKIGSAEEPVTTGTYYGLFSELSAGGSVANLHLNVEIYTNSATKDPSLVGGLAGSCLGTINNCTVDGIVTAASTVKLYAGGLVGQLGDIKGTATMIINSVNKANVTVNGASNKNTRGGGLAGYMEGTATSAGSIINCANLGNVSVPTGRTGSNTQAGGLVGRVNYGTIQNAFNAGTVTLGADLGNLVGSLVGHINSITASKCYYLEGTKSSGSASVLNANGAAIAMPDMAGDALLTALNENVVSMSATYSGLLSWSKMGDHIVPAESTSPTPTNPPEATASPTPTEPPEVTATPAPTNPPIEVPADTWIAYASDSFEGGDGSEADPYIIKTAEQLALLAKNAYLGEDYSGKYFEIADDVTELDLAAYQWTPIKVFAGVFDGNKATIKNLNIGVAGTGKDISNAGLFELLSAGSMVSNLNVEVSIHTNYTGSEIHLVGAVAAKSNGTVSNCMATGQINAQAKSSILAGGLIGQAVIASENVLVTNCGNNADVSGSSSQAEARIGGIVGSIDERSSGQTKTVSIVNCYNTGNVVSAVTGGSSRPRSGGIAGWIREQNQTGVVWIHNSYNTGNVTITSCASASLKGTLGSIVGSLNSAWTGYSNLYTLENLEVANDYATVQNCAKEAMSLDNMKAASFASTLNANANILTAENGYTGLLKWVAVADVTPVFSDDIITGQAVFLQVSVNSERLGKVFVEADELGGTSYTEIATSALLEKNSSVKLTFAPTAGCVVSKVMVNGTAVEIQNNTYSFTMTEATDIVVTFEVSQAVEVDAIYVKPDAAVNGDGTEQSPFRTLKQAADKVSSVLEVMPTANITVYLMDGTYRLDESLALDENHTSLGRVTFKNYQNETPVITSGHKINANEFTLDAGKGYYSYQLPDSAKSAEGEYPAFRDLLVNGERATIARTEDLIFKLSFKNQVLEGTSKVASCDNALYVSSEALAGITNENLNGVELVQLIEWKSQLFHIAGITGIEVEGEKEITLNAEEWENFYETDNTKKNLVDREYWLQNHLNFLDEPGEFYYDQNQGIIYYYPYADQQMDVSTTIEYVTLDILIDIENAANITFDGITFHGTTANLITEKGLVAHNYCTLRRYKNDPGENIPIAAIHGNMVEGIRVLNCTFEELGGSAMVFDYGIKDLEVTGNVMKDIAMAGILVGNPQREWNQDGILGASEDVTINNNYITNIGLVVCGAPGIKVSRSQNLKIQHNTIIHVPYCGIQAGYGYSMKADGTEAWYTNLVNADISYNYVEDFVYKINDGGAIYTAGASDFVANKNLINYIHHNYIRAGAHNTTYTGIYHDGCASNVHTYENVIDDLKSKKGPMFFQDDVAAQATHNILAENNYTTVSAITQKGDKDSNGDLRNIVLQNNSVFEDRSVLSAEALAIKNNAGLEEAYKHIVSPMDVELRIADSSMHYMVDSTSEVATQISVELTNNYDQDKEFTITLTDELPEYITCGFADDGVSVTVAAGETKLVTTAFQITNVEEFADSEDYVVGLKVEDATGRSTLYPRTFTVKASTGIGKIAYGTPDVDGILDDTYKNSTKIFFGDVFNATYYNAEGKSTKVDLTNANSDLTGYCYLLWDETYLYCYAFVQEGTVMSRGKAYIEEVLASGKPNNLWRSDSIEPYINTTYMDGKETKFAVDAFGIQRFGANSVALSVHNALEYATAFTYNGKIVEGLEIKAPEANQLASTSEQPVNGYVVEMTLPLTECTDLEVEGQPQAGDMITFRVQNNDHQGAYTGVEDSVYIVSKTDIAKEYTLIKQEDKPIEKAVIGENRYATFEAALADAVAGDEIDLKDNVTVTDTYITKDITIDLNGNKLTADSLVTFDADIVDNSQGKTGLLVCDKLMIPQNSQMPVYDSSKNGYRLVTVTHQIAQKTDDSTQTTKYLSLTVRPGFEGVDSIHSLLAGGNSKVRMGIRLTWDNGNCVQDCYFSSDLVKAMYENSKSASFTLTGLDAYEDLTATSIVVSNDANKESVYATPCSPASVTTAE